MSINAGRMENMATRRERECMRRYGFNAKTALFRRHSSTVYNVRRKIANAPENITLSKFVPQQAAAPSGACVDGLAYSPILSPA